MKILLLRSVRARTLPSAALLLLATIAAPAAGQDGTRSDPVGTPARAATGSRFDPACRAMVEEIQGLLASSRAGQRRSGLQMVRLLTQRYGTASLDPLVPAFQRLVNDPDAEVKRDMLVLMQGFHDPRMLPPLIEVLQKDPAMRPQALMALPATDDPRLLPVLTQLLQDPSQTTVSLALERLERFADASLIPAVVAALRTATHLHVFTAAESLLTKVGAPAVAPLLDAMTSENSGVRRVAVKVLGNLGDARALEAILAALEDRDFFVARNATEALASLGASGLREAILARLDHADPLVRSRAAEILGVQRVPEAMAGLIAGLQDRNATVQASSATALGKLGDPAAAVPLIAALRDPKFRARAEAAGALARFSDRETQERIAGALAGAEASPREWLVVALRKMGPAAQETLIALLRHPEVPVRLEALEALSYQVSPRHGGQRDPRVVDRILAFVAEDPAFLTMNENERIFLLQRLEDPRAVRHLLAMARATGGEVPQTLRLALGEQGDPVVTRELIAALGDEDVALRRAAAYVLGFVQAPEAIEPLLRTWSDPDPVVRKWAVWSVGYSYDFLKSTLDAADLARRFTSVLENRREDPEVRMQAAEALMRLKQGSSEAALIRVLKDRSEPTPLRIRAAQTLQGSRSRAASNALNAVKSDPSEPPELREACMTPEEILNRYTQKKGRAAGG